MITPEQFYKERVAELEREVERLRVVEALSVAINRAAKELTQGWLIELGVENGAAWVTLFDADCGEVEFPCDDRTLAEQVEEAIAASRSTGAADVGGNHG